MPLKEKKPAKKGNKLITTQKHPRKGPASALRSSGVGEMRRTKGGPDDQRAGRKASTEPSRRAAAMRGDDRSRSRKGTQ